MSTWILVSFLVVLCLELAIATAVALALRRMRFASKAPSPAIVHCRWTDDEVRRFYGIPSPSFLPEPQPSEAATRAMAATAASEQQN